MNFMKTFLVRRVKKQHRLIEMKELDAPGAH